MTSPRAQSWDDAKRNHRSRKARVRRRRAALDAAAIRPTDTLAAAADRKAARQAEHEDPAFLAWVRTLPCLAVDGACHGRVEAHHEPPRSHAGDWHDRKTVPLCVLHHALRHGVLGLAKFEARFGLDLAAAIERLNMDYDRNGGASF